MMKPRNRPKNFAWSFSTLEAYELCPKKYAAERVYKTVREAPNEKRDFGTRAHKDFQLRIEQAKPLPPTLGGHEPILNVLANGDGAVEAEVSLALTRDYEQTVWNDWNNVWVRGAADYLHTYKSNDRGLVLDWKFGKTHTKQDQLDLMAAMTMTIRPQLKSVEAAYYWAPTKKFGNRKTYDRQDMTAIWGEYRPRVADMERAWEEETFPARRNFLCRKWCPVKSCPHNGI